MTPSAEVWKLIWSQHVVSADPSVTEILVNVLVALTKSQSAAGSPTGASTTASGTPKTPSNFAPARGAVGIPTSVEPQSSSALVSAYAVATDQVARGKGCNKFGSDDRDSRQAQRLAMLKRKTERKQQEVKQYKQHAAVQPPEKLVSVIITMYRPGQVPQNFSTAITDLAGINIKHAKEPLDAFSDWASDQVELPMAERVQFFFADGLVQLKLTKRSRLVDLHPQVMCNSRVELLLKSRKIQLFLIHRSMLEGLVDCKTWVVEPREEVAGDSGSEFDDKPKRKGKGKSSSKGKLRRNSDSEGEDSSDGKMLKVKPVVKREMTNDEIDEELINFDVKAMLARSKEKRENEKRENEKRESEKREKVTVVDLTVPDVRSVKLAATPSASQPPAHPTAVPMKPLQPPTPGGEERAGHMSVADVNSILDNSGITPAPFQQDRRLTKAMFATTAEGASDDDSEGSAAPDSDDDCQDPEDGEEQPMSAAEEDAAPLVASKNKQAADLADAKVESRPQRKAALQHRSVVCQPGKQAEAAAELPAQKKAKISSA
jgi:hypothetical protein